MPHKILILGGYGNFGKRIARALVDANISVIIAGRSLEKASVLAAALGPLAEAVSFDANLLLASQLQALKPVALINTCGPFQLADYRIAQTCIDHRIHYIDLADGRDFVAGITALDAKAKANNVSVISGASTVPALSSAVLEAYKHEFSVIESLRFGISLGQQSERGVATTQSVLSYVGKRLKPYAGHAHPYGWQNLYRQAYPGLGKRWMANCDIPDLDLLPARYNIRSIQFSAGLELGVLHVGLWMLSWLVRLGAQIHIAKYAALLLSLSNKLDRFGSADGGMHMILRGKDTQGNLHERRWFIIAKDGSGPHIPTIPAIILAKKLATGESFAAGAYPCVAMVTLSDYLRELDAFPITAHVT